MTRLFVTLALVFAVVACTVTAAAPKTFNGTITKIDGTKISITLEGERPDWLKKNAFVKFKIGTGKVVEAAAADAAPFTFVVNFKKASEMKVDEAITFQKGLAVSGC